MHSETTTPIIAALSREVNIHQSQVARTVALLDDGNTIPFIARYRKEVTGALDEEQLRTIESRLAYLRNLQERKTVVLNTIEEQGKLTQELAAQISVAVTLQEVEDLYLPYKPKRRTRATIARERGLEPLAQMILSQARPSLSLDRIAAGYVGAEVPDVEAALAGARDIVAEIVAEDARVRQGVRQLTHDQGSLSVSLVAAEKDPQGKYRDYYDFNEPVKRIPPHRLLALNRGEKEDVLRVSIALGDSQLIGAMLPYYPTNSLSPFAPHLQLASQDSAQRLLFPSIEREVRHSLSEVAGAHAIRIFTANMRNLLMQPPLRGKRIMGIDPGFRTGCKIAVVDGTGKFKGGTTIYPHEPQKRWQEAVNLLLEPLRLGEVEVIAIGNGTASRETELLAAEVCGQVPGSGYTIVSEAGASVYSASPLARKEFPNLDVSMRGAISIARRLQDPLAELVKIDPKSIGVGLYQHDVDQKDLDDSLTATVESVVNRVGVDLNTASAALLSYIAGLTSRVAEAIVAYREEHGPFATRAGLLKVPGLGPKTFQQAAGFLRIPGGQEPMDNTAIHPESYAAARKLMDVMGLLGREGNMPGRLVVLRSQLQTNKDWQELAETLEVGIPTLRDMLENLERPGRDPRDEIPPVILRRDVLRMEDLLPGMVLQGTVRNVVDFGAFVDIGVKQDGLVHVSEMSGQYVRNPLEVVGVGDIIEVRVLSIDPNRGRIALSMRKTPV
ncbi:MAG: RNA-binding transcriptional accessory protein [Chloroflexi bacterium]|nr:RNA-binding transcriptional accessory protein [Chloroflexota bacterium]